MAGCWLHIYGDVILDFQGGIFIEAYFLSSLVDIRRWSFIPMDMYIYVYFGSFNSLFVSFG